MKHTPAWQARRAEFERRRHELLHERARGAGRATDMTLLVDTNSEGQAPALASR